jgi:hypothetical protein
MHYEKLDELKHILLLFLKFLDTRIQSTTGLEVI